MLTSDQRSDAVKALAELNGRRNLDRSVRVLDAS